MIDRSLKAEPRYQLPADFALKVSGAIVRRIQWKTDLKEYFLIVGIVAALLSVVFGIYYFANEAVFAKMIGFVSGNLIPLALIVLTLNFVFFADRVLLPLMFNRWSKS